MNNIPKNPKYPNVTRKCFRNLGSTKIQVNPKGNPNLQTVMQWVNVGDGDEEAE